MERRVRITWWIIFCIRLRSIYLKKHGGNTDNPSIKMYVNKVENRITFRIKTGYYLEVVMPQMMTKDKDN